MKVVVVMRPEEGGRLDLVGPFDSERAASDWVAAKVPPAADGKPTVTTHLVTLWDPADARVYGDRPDG
jgi:hypothetical protein